MTDVLVFVAQQRVAAAAAALGAASRATGIGVRLEQYATGTIFQRLQTRRAQPPPDLVVWFGPYAAHAAARDGLLRPYQPARFAPRTVHHPDWHWVATEFSMFSANQVSSLAELTSVPHLAVADAERSESGLMLLLASLDRARQVDGDVETAWRWWQQRARAGMTLFEDEAAALRAAATGRASHAVNLQVDGSGLLGLAPLPHALALTSAGRNTEAARTLVDWLAGDEASTVGTLSAWAAESNGLAARLDAAPPLDVEWATAQYSAMRLRWARSGFGPSSDAA